MAVDRPARPSREQSLERIANTLPQRRQLPVTNLESGVPPVEDRPPALNGRKKSIRSRAPTLLSRSRSQGRAEEKPSGIVRRLSRSRSRGQKEGALRERHLNRSRPRSQTLSSSDIDVVARELSDLPSLQLPPISNADVNDVSMIGVAFGSPTRSRHPIPEPPPQPVSQDIEPNVANFPGYPSDGLTSKPKGARWRKIGGLFRARTAFMNEPTLSSLGPSKLSQADQFDDRAKPKRDAQATSREQDARYLFDNILGSDGQLDSYNDANGSRDHVFGERGGNVQAEHRQKGGMKEMSHHQASPQASSSLLEVSIPSVQMERYSVMFESLLDNREPSNLLARRGKAFHRLMPLSDKDDASHGEDELPKEQSTNLKTTSNETGNVGLKPESHSTYPRRATSPTSSYPKSPSFSLFPQLHQEPDVKPVPKLPAGSHSPLRRSFTAPDGISLMRDLKHDDGKITESTTDTTRTTDSKGDSCSQSIQSYASTSTSVNEQRPLDLKSLDAPSTQKNRPELVAPHTLAVPSLELSPSGPIGQSGNVRDPSTEEKSPAAKAMHRDTLAALEWSRSPISQNDELGLGLKLSKIHVDQIMKASPSKQQPKPPAGMAAETVSASQEGSKRMENRLPLGGDAPRPSDQAEGKRPAATETETVAAARWVQDQPAIVAKRQDVVATPIPGRPLGSHAPRANETTQSASARPYPPRYESTIGRIPTKETHPDIRQPQHVSSYAEARKVPQPVVPSADAPRGPFSRSPAPNADRPFPKRILPPQNPRVCPPAAASFHRAPPAQRLRNPPAITPPTDKDGDQILDYYLDETRKRLAPRPTEPRRPMEGFRPVPSDGSDRRPSPPRNRSPPKLVQAAARSPLVPTSKYSPNAAAATSNGLPRQIIPSPVPSSTSSMRSQNSSSSSTDQPQGLRRERQREQDDSIKQQHSLPRPTFLGPTSRSINAGASTLNASGPRTTSKATAANQTPKPTSKHERPTLSSSSLSLSSSSSSPPLPPLPSSTSPTPRTFYSHSNKSSPNLNYTGFDPSPCSSPSTSSTATATAATATTTTNPTTTVPDSPLLDPPAQSQSRSQHPIRPALPPHLLFTRSTSAPITTTSTTTTTTSKPTPKIRLDPERGEKVLQCRAGLVPTIVDPTITNGNGNANLAAAAVMQTARMSVVKGQDEGEGKGEGDGRGMMMRGRSVNLVIESV